MNVVETPIRHDYDMIAGTRFPGDETDDLIGGSESKCSFSTRADSFGHAIRRQRFSRSQMRRPINTGDDDRIGWIERLHKSLLKYSAPARLRARLKNGPN